MKDRNVPQVMWRERERENEEGKGGWIWLRHFLYMYEYGTLKLVEVISKRGMGEEEEGWQVWIKPANNICMYRNVTMTPPYYNTNI
jgi:hypothetical protein